MKLLFLSANRLEHMAARDTASIYCDQVNPRSVFESVFILERRSSRLGFHSQKLENACVLYRCGLGINALSWVCELLTSLFLIKRYKIDIIFALNPAEHGLLGVALQTISGVPCAYQANNDYEYAFVLAAGRRSLRARIVAALESFICRRSRFVFFHSEYFRILMARRGASEGRLIERFWIGYFMQFFAEGARAKAPENDELRLLFCGRLNQQKDPLGLIKAFHWVKAQIPKAQLLIVGQGEMRPEMERLILDLGLTGVVFLGEHSRVELRDYFSSSHILVHPTLFEGYSNVLQEAQATGLPIVTTDVPFQEGLVDPTNAVLVPPRNPDALANAVLSVGCDRALWRRLSEASRSKYEWYRTVKKPLERNADTFTRIFKATRLERGLRRMIFN